jgi:hypothetical protein
LNYSIVKCFQQRPQIERKLIKNRFLTLLACLSLLSASAAFGAGGTKVPEGNLTIENGYLDLSPTGKGVIFPDGTVQTTKASGGSVTSVTVADPLTNIGTATNPVISLTGSIADSNLATISTAGKIANSATTATSINSANSIVVRDSAGNFSAGTITGNFTGNVSGNATTATSATTATNVTGTVAVANGGTGAINSTSALNNILPAQSGNSGKVLSTDGGGTISWVSPGSVDSTPPVPGSSGTITATNSGLNIALSWTPATDNVTPQANLEYTVFYSTSSNISTITNAEANGIVVGMPWSSNLTSKTVSGLTIGTTYYFNVAVKDAGLNKAVYTTVSKVPAVPATNIILYGHGTAFTGNLGGRSGANAKCVASANKPAGYSNFAAFLSVNSSDTIAGRQAFSGLDTSRNIRSANGTLIANNWADLLDGTISNTLASAGINIPTGFWNSGANADGTLGQTCNAWTVGAAGSTVDWGVPGSATSTWINPGATGKDFCADLSDILCIAW